MSGIPRKKIYIMVAGMFIVPGLLLGGYTLLKNRSKSEVTGSITLPNRAEVAAVRCASGRLSEDAPRNRPQFHGVDVFAGDLVVRAFEDVEKGTVVTVRRGKDAPVTVDRAGCEQFDVTLKETDEMILDHWGFDGRLVLKCAELVADVRFASCYDGS